MSTKEAQLKLELTTVVVRGTHQNNEHTYTLPPDNVEPFASKDEVIQFNSILIEVINLNYFIIQADGGELSLGPDLTADSSCLSSQHIQTETGPTSSSSSIKTHQKENNDHLVNSM